MTRKDGFFSRYMYSKMIEAELSSRLNVAIEQKTRCQLYLFQGAK
jgi:hypothetical protein